ncbi:MAG TPA: hypothetical protein VLC09_09195 [Polyangiaceae bacterium]|nr:hypothetical protein [Polyangiaceae bacterium]
MAGEGAAVVKVLERLLPLALDLVPAIAGALENREDTTARRLLQEGLTRQALEEEAIGESAGAPHRGSP